MADYKYVPLPDGRIGRAPVGMSDQEVYKRFGLAAPASATPQKRDAFSAGLEAAKSGLTVGLPYALNKLTETPNTVQPGDDEYYQSRLRESAAKQEQLLPGGPAGFGQGASLGRIVGENLAYSAPQMVAQGLGGAAGTVLGGPVGAGLGVGLVGAPMYVGSNVDRATQGGQTALTGGQAARSFAASIPQAAVDVLGARFLPGVGKYLGEEGFTGNILSRALKGTAAGIVTEGGGEALQQVGERYSAGLDLTDQEALGEYGQAAAIGGLLGGGFGAVGGATNTTKIKEQRAAAAAEAAAAGRPADLLNASQLDLQGGTYNEKAGPAARKSVNLADNVRAHLNLGEDENVDEVVKSLQDQRRAIVSAVQDAQAKGDQASFYKLTDALAAHDNQYFKSSDPDVIAQRTDLVQKVEDAQTAAASAQGRKGKRAEANLASAKAELSRFDRTKNISPVQEYINAQQKEAARSTQTDLLSNVGRMSTKPVDEQAGEGAQYDLFGNPAVVPETGTEVAQTETTEPLPVKTDGNTPLFDRRPTSTVALDFTPRNITRNLRGTQPLKGNPKGYTTTLAARMAPLFQSGDVKGLAELLSSELEKKSQLPSVDQYLPILRRAKAMATDFANRAETAKREEINIRAQEGQARSTGGTTASGAPTMQDAVSIARNRDQNAQAAAGEQAQAQQAAAQEQAVIQQAQANQAQAAQVAENSKRTQILTNILRNPDIDNYYNAFEKQLADLGMNPAVSDNELAAINAAKNAQERRAAGREVFTATEADVITEELQNAFDKIEATTQSGTAERVIAKRNATMEAITKAVDLVGAAETDALEAIEKLVGKTSYKQAEQSWQKMMAAKEEALNAPTEAVPTEAAAQPEARTEAPEAPVAEEAAVEPTVAEAAPVTTETINAAQEGEQPQSRKRQRKRATEVGTAPEASSSNRTKPVAETAEEIAARAAEDIKANQEAKENFWRVAEIKLTGPEGQELNVVVLDKTKSLDDVKAKLAEIEGRGTKGAAQKAAEPAPASEKVRAGTAPRVSVTPVTNTATLQTKARAFIKLLPGGPAKTDLMNRIASAKTQKEFDGIEADSKTAFKKVAAAKEKALADAATAKEKADAEAKAKRAKLVGTLMLKRQAAPTAIETKPTATKRPDLPKDKAKPIAPMAKDNPDLPKVFFHGTSKENAEKIEASGGFKPGAGKPHYSYSEFGRLATYFTAAQGWWLNAVKAANGRAAIYTHQVTATLNPSSRIVTIKTAADLKALAEKAGFKSGYDFMKTLFVEGLTDTEEAARIANLSLSDYRAERGPWVEQTFLTDEQNAESKASWDDRIKKIWEDSKNHEQELFGEADALTRKLVDIGVDGIYIGEGVDVGPADNQLALFRPELAKITETGPIPAPVISTIEQQVQDGTIHDHLTDGDRTTIAKEYGEPTYNDKAKAQFAQDVIDAVNGVGRKLSAVLDAIVKRVANIAVSLAIVFNPMALQAVNIKVPTAIASTIKTETNITAVPKDAAAKMSVNAQYVYEVSAATAKSLNKGFFIADKPNGVIHVFDKTGKMIASGPALYGMSSGDVLTKGNSLVTERAEDKVTPAGTFTLLAAKNAEYTGGYTLKLKETAQSGGVIAIHSVYTGEVAENRQGRLASKTVADNKISFGCINTSAKMFLTNILPTINEFDGGLAFVLPDKVENTKTLFKPTVTKKAAPAQFLQKTKVQPLADNAKQVAERAAVEAKFRAELDRLGVAKAGLRILTQLEGRAEYGRDVGGEYSPAKKLITVVMQPNSKGEYSLGHEAIHAMEHFGLILPQEKAAILGWAKGQKEIRDFIKSQYGEESQAIQDSEYVAEAYALWLKREAEFPGRINLFFRKLTGFLGAFKNYLLGRGFISADALLEAVDAGFFTQRQQGKATLGQTSKTFFRESTASQEYTKANDRVREYVGGYGNSIAAAMVIANKLTDMAVRAGVPAARTMERLLADQGRITARLDRKIEDLSERFDGLKNAVEKGVGEGSVNNVIQKIRFAKKWGFDPMYKDADGKKINVDVDPELNKLFNKLSPEAQQVVKDVFQLSRDNLYAKKEAVMRTIGSEYDALIKSTRDDLKTATGERAIKLAREVKNLEAKKSRQLTRYESLLRIDPNTPYAPIKRFGDFVVVGRSKEYVAAEQKAAREKTPEAYAELRKMQEDGEHYYVAYADDRWKAILLRDKIAQVYDAPDMFRKDEASEAQIGGSEIYAAFQRMQKMIQEQGDSMDPKMRKSLTALATDLYLGTLAESSSRKAEMAARLVHGGDFDMVRGAIAQGRSDARFIGSIEKNGEIADAITQMKKEAKAGGTNTDQARELVNQITARHAANLAPAPQNKTIDKVLSFTTAMYLTTSPMFFVQQAVQPFMVSVPVAAAKHGYGRTMDALNKGYDVVRQAWGDADITKPLDLDKLKGTMWAVAQVIADSNALDVAIDKDMGNWTSEANGPINTAMTTVSKKLGGWTRKLEAINRLSTGVMMFELEMGKTTGQNVDPEAYKSYVEDFKKTHPEGATEEHPMLSEQQYVATQEAIRLIMDTHGDYSLKASPLFMRSGAGRVLSQFKKFQIMQLSLYTQAINDGFFAKDIPAAEKEIARRTLLYMTGHAALFAGALGLPGAAAGEWLWELINKLMGREGPFTAEGDLRKAIGNPTIANLLINGAPTLAGVDLSGSLGQGNLLSIAPYADIPKDEDTYKEAIIRMAGPAIGGVGLDYAKALGFMNDGQYYKGLEKMLPKGFSNAIKAYRESTEGVTDKGGETTVGAKNIGIGATVATALGLRTTEVSNRQYRQGAAIETKQFFQDKTSTLKREYIKAYDKKDGSKMQELRVKWLDLQKSRDENGLSRQPISDLIREPMRLAKREKNVFGGVKVSKSNRAMAEQLAEETGFVEPDEE